MGDLHTIEYEIIALSKLHIGCGMLPELPTSPKPVYRVYSQDGHVIKLMIPGSTLKGITRHIADKLSSVYGYSSCKSVKPEEIVDQHRKMGGKCDVCNLFGTPGGYSSKIYFLDAFANISPKLLDMYTGILIDRSKMVVREKHLYSYEIIPAGTKFHGSIITYGFTELDWKILLIALSEIPDEGIGLRRGDVDFKIVKITPDLSNELVSKIQNWLGDRYESIFSEVKK
ncbi:MAG: RAMP superfamily CRISPR-associated protein [Candidatus Asgardarchaeia archaeon]